MSNRRKWEKREEEFLKQNAGKMTQQEIADYLGRTLNAVKIKSAHLGISFGCRAWTEEEKNYLEENWCNISHVAIAENLGRTVRAVTHMANRMDLGSPLYSIDGLSLYAVRRIFRISEAKVKRVWIGQRKLPSHTKIVSTKRRVTYIRINEFWEWAKDNRDCVNFAHLEPLILGEEPEWVAEARRMDSKNTCKAKIKRNVWTAHEEARLLALLTQYKYYWDEIAKMLGRTEGAIKFKIYQKGWPYRPLARDQKLWTNDEINLCISMWEQGRSYSAIAVALGRSESSVKWKFATLHQEGKTEKRAN